MGRPGDRLRTALSLLAIGLGVGVVLAIQLANRASIGSFQDSLRQISGRTNLTVTGTNGVDELLLPELNRLLGPEAHLSPVIESTAVAAATGQVVQVLGIDILEDSPFRDTELGGVETSPRDFLLQLTDPRSVVVGETFARRHGLQSGAEVELLLNDRRETYTVRGILAPRGPAAALAGNLILMDIAAAQMSFGRLGRVDRIDLIVPEDELPAYERRISDWLPAGMRVERPEARAEQAGTMLRAFRWNLTALSYVSLLVGAFLIYNTIGISVVRRRREIGVLRALGATRPEVVWLFLNEAVLLGLAGGVLGLGMGRLLAEGALRLVAGTVNTLYVSATPGVIEFSAGLVLEALVIGGVTALLAALAPAMESARVQPAETMRTGAHEERTSRAGRRAGLGAAALLGLGWGASRLPAVAGLPLFGYLSVLLVIAGFYFLMPSLLVIFTRLVERPVRALLGVEGTLAVRGLATSPGRIATLTMSLATAVAMMASVAIMVGSFRDTLEVWSEQTLRADLFLKPTAQVAGSRGAVIPPEAIQMVRQMEGVEAVDPFRAVESVYEWNGRGHPYVLASGDWKTLVRHGNLLFLDGRKPEEVMAGETQRAVIVSEPFANRYRVSKGDALELDTPAGRLAFDVRGVFYDYGNDRGTVVLDRPVFSELFRDDTASSLAIYLRADADTDVMSEQLSAGLGAAGYAMLITPNARLQQAVLRVFDRTFSITYALEAVAILVAALGIANALLAWVIERRRQFGILRVIGASRRQLRKMILTDAFLVGLLGNLTGGLMGFLLSWVLIFSINVQSFGWTIQFHMPYEFLALAGLAILVTTVAAGLYPARVAGRFDPGAVLAAE